MKIAHLTASTFFGGPERQMLGLAKCLPATIETAFLSFSEGGRCHPFLGQVRKAGFEGVALKADTPRLRAAVVELHDELARLGTQILCCHGYKANLLGRIAATRHGIPALAVARGWTGESLKVHFYEKLDRFHLRWMAHVVCVSEAQAIKVRRAGVPAKRVSVIANAVDAARFMDPDPHYRAKLLRSFRQPKTTIVGAAGRLSPEKGFDTFVQAADIVRRSEPNVGFVLFGDGPCKDRLVDQVKSLGLTGCFALSGFRADLDRHIPFLDLFVLPSHTEGLPNVVLEAFAAGVPVVATAVGGTPEIVSDGVNGYLVSPGNPEALAKSILKALACPDRLREMGINGRETVCKRFAFSEQAAQYLRLFGQLLTGGESGSRSREEPMAPLPANDSPHGNARTPANQVAVGDTPEAETTFVGATPG